MDNQEILFAKKLQELRELASSQNMTVSKDQIVDIFEDLELSEESFNLICDYLKKKKIGIGDAVDLDEYLNEDEKNFLNDYLEEIKDLPSYNDGEKEVYFMRAISGEKEGKEKTVEIMLPVVVDLAKLYTDQGVMLEDLIGEGNVALSAAVEMLGALDDPKEVVSTLSKMIMDAMEALVAEEADDDSQNSEILQKVNDITEAAREVAESLQRKITVKELAEEGNFSEEEILDAIRISANHIQYFEGSKE